MRNNVGHFDIRYFTKVSSWLQTVTNWKYSIVIILILIISLKAASQEHLKQIDYIISIDERIPYSLSTMKFVVFLKGNTQKSIKAGYYPGRLSLDTADYESLHGENVDSIKLVFTYSEFPKDKDRIDYDYEIPLSKGTWVADYFFVLYIYNTDKPKYRKILDPIKGKHYTYEFDYPGGHTSRIRNVGKK